MKHFPSYSDLTPEEVFAWSLGSSDSTVSYWSYMIWTLEPRYKYFQNSLNKKKYHKRRRCNWCRKYVIQRKMVSGKAKVGHYDRNQFINIIPILKFLYQDRMIQECNGSASYVSGWIRECKKGRGSRKGRLKVWIQQVPGSNSLMPNFFHLNSNGVTSRDVKIPFCRRTIRSKVSHGKFQKVFFGEQSSLFYIIATEWRIIWIRGQFTSHDTKVVIQTISVPIFNMRSVRKDDVGLWHTFMIQPDRIIFEGKWCGKCINISVFIRKLSTSNKSNDPSASGYILKGDYGWRKTSSREKYYSI